MGRSVSALLVLGQGILQITKGKPHNTAIRSLAFKWIRIAFKCWKEQAPYDESKCLEALKRRGSPLLDYAIKC